MCTLIALHRSGPGLRLVVAANRDEYLDRPAEPPALRSSACGPLVAPRDVRAGGSWLAVNRSGLFAALTNRATQTPDPRRRSRGLLVLDALGFPSARAAAAALLRLPARAYNPFNLLVADAQDAYAVVYDAGPRRLRLAPGVHVLGNADPNARAVPKLDRMLGRAEAAAQAAPDRVLDELATICRDHAGDGPLGAACVHAGRYGTRSSTLLRLGAAGPVLLHAEGPPCSTAYQDFTPLLLELDRSRESGPGGPVARKAS